MCDPLERHGFTALYYESGESLRLPLADFDQVSSIFEALAPGERRIWRGETVTGMSIAVNLGRIDTIIEHTAAEVARLDALEAQQKLAGD